MDILYFFFSVVGMGAVLSELEDKQRAIVREELDKSSSRIQPPQQTSSGPVHVEHASEETVLAALCAIKQAEYRSKFTTVGAVTGVVTGLMLQSVRAGSLPSKIASIPVATLGE